MVIVASQQNRPVLSLESQETRVRLSDNARSLVRSASIMGGDTPHERRSHSEQQRHPHADEKDGPHQNTQQHPADKDRRRGR